MTNEQTAILLGGYLSELTESIETMKCFLEPTMIKNNGISVSLGGEEELATYPQMQSIFDLADRLQRDIDNLNNVQAVFSSVNRNG